MSSLAGQTAKTATPKDISSMRLNINEMDRLLLQDAPHTTYTDVCPLCICRAAYLVQMGAHGEVEARRYLSQISIQTINDAIKQVSECLDDFQLVRPIVGEVVA